MAVRLHWNNQKGTLDRLFRDNSVGVFMAETCARYMDKFVPMDTGALSQNFTTEPFQITYTQNYASKCYYGDHINFHLDKHPNATSHWDRPTSEMHGADIAKEVTEFMRRR